MITQGLIVLAIVLAALAVGHALRQRFRRGGYAAQSGWMPIVFEAAVVAAPAFVALVLLLIARAMLGEQPIGIVHTATQLGAVLLIVRLT
ncbi:hypothetical protein EON77_00690, partial [bacterium]